MQNFNVPFTGIAKKSFLSMLVVAIITLPLSPMSSLANEDKSDDVKVLKAAKIKKAPAGAAVEKTQNSSTKIGKEASSDDVKILEATSVKTSPKGAVVEKTEIPKGEGGLKSLSTKTKIGIGVGAAVIVGGVVALAAGGSGGGDSNSGPPTADEMPGPWHAEGVGHVQNMTYSGTYTFYSGGTHSYSLVFTDNANGAQEYLSGGGTWFIRDAYFEMHNQTGSVYTGSFTDKNNITVTTTNGWWTTTLSR